MVSVAEQFSSLRQTLGSILGIFTLLRYLRTLLARLTGRPPPADATSLTPSAFFAFQGLPGPDGSPSSPSPARPSKKPFLVFLLAVFGLPYLMGKLIRALARSQEHALHHHQDPTHTQPLLPGPDGRPQPPDQQSQPQPLDPSKLDFCRVLYDYSPEASTTPTEGIDLAVSRGHLVAVLSKKDPSGQPSEWWRCRARNGKVGYLPALYLEPIQRRQQQIAGAGTGGSSESSRAGTMTTVVGSEGNGGGKGEGGGVSAEGFMKSQFYD